jgi:hypothetical protein
MRRFPGKSSVRLDRSLERFMATSSAGHRCRRAVTSPPWSNPPRWQPISLHSSGDCDREPAVRADLWPISRFQAARTLLRNFATSLLGRFECAAARTCVEADPVSLAALQVRILAEACRARRRRHSQNRCYDISRPVTDNSNLGLRSVANSSVRSTLKKQT